MKTMKRKIIYMLCIVAGIAVGLVPFIFLRPKAPEIPVIILERPRIVDAENIESFIRSVCETEGVPYYFALAILSVENPERNPSAIHQNDDDTFDLGLWQLNSRWIFHDFVNRYWKIAEEFNWADPKDNTILAIRHMAWLFQFGFTDYQVAVGYNGGYSAAISETAGTNTYALRVLRTEVELLQEALKLAKP